MVHLTALPWTGIFFYLYEGPKWGQHIPAEGLHVCCRQSLTLTFLVLMFLFIKPKVLFAFDVMQFIMWEFHDRSLDMSTPKYLSQETTSKT